MIARLFLRLRIGVTSVALLGCALLVGACNGGGADDALDADGDGFAGSHDCNDDDASVHPSATEHCNEVDDDCDGDVDEGVLLTFYIDADDDTYGSDAEMVEACSEVPGATNNRLDCDDSDPEVHPNATEICGNGMDEDCDGQDLAADTWYADADNDGYGDLATTVGACDTPPSGFVADATDCDDGDAAVNPDATEICANGTDEDCDGEDLTTFSTWYADADGDGYGDPAATTEWCDPPSGFVDDSSDCDDGDAAVNPGAEERCDNAIDDDCDKVIASSADADADGWYADACVGGFDCDEGDATIHPDAVETCDDKIDSDCDGNDCLLDDGAICSGKLAEPDAVLPKVGGSCDSKKGFVEFGGHCYLFVETAVAWPVARANCVEAGGYLATVADEDENAFIDDNTNNPWLGACDADAEGTWTWVTGEPWAYEYWNAGEPNDLDGEDCMEMYADDASGGVWNDNACDSTDRVEGYVCEFELL